MPLDEKLSPKKSFQTFVVVLNEQSISNNFFIYDLPLN